MLRGQLHLLQNHADGMTVIVSSLRVNVYDGIAPIGAYVDTITDHKNYCLLYTSDAADDP